jgi:hypothetical protein
MAWYKWLKHKDRDIPNGAWCLHILSIVPKKNMVYNMMSFNYVNIENELKRRIIILEEDSNF